MLSDLKRKDRKRSGLTIGQAAWRMGVTQREYREIEAGERYPSSDAYERMVELFDWPPRVREPMNRRERWLAGLPDRIRTEREARGWSPDELARRVGVSRWSVRQWERRVTRPTLETFAAIADAFGWPMPWS